MNGAAEVFHTAAWSRIILLEMLLFALVSFDGLEVSASFGWWSSRVDRMFACGPLVYFSGLLEWLCHLVVPWGLWVWGVWGLRFLPLGLGA